MLDPILGVISSANTSEYYPNNWAYTEIVWKDIFGISLAWAWTNFTASAQICYTSSGAIIPQNSYLYLDNFSEGTGSNPRYTASILKTYSSNTQDEINITACVEFVNYWPVILYLSTPQIAYATFYNALIIQLNGQAVHAYGILGASEGTVIVQFPVDSAVYVGYS